MVRVLEVGITSLTVLEGGGSGPAEKKKKGLRAAQGFRPQRWVAGWDRVLPVFLLRNKLPSSPLSNEGPKGE